MSDAQKDRKILSLLTKLRNDGVIKRDSESKQLTNWILNEDKNG